MTDLPRFTGPAIVKERLVFSVHVKERAGKLYAVVVDRAGDAWELGNAAKAVREAVDKRVGDVLAEAAKRTA